MPAAWAICTASMAPAGSGGLPATVVVQLGMPSVATSRCGAMPDGTFFRFWIAFRIASRVGVAPPSMIGRLAAMAAMIAWWLSATIGTVSPSGTPHTLPIGYSFSPQAIADCVRDTTVSSALTTSPHFSIGWVGPTTWAIEPDRSRISSSWPGWLRSWILLSPQFMPSVGDAGGVGGVAEAASGRTKPPAPPVAAGAGAEPPRPPAGVPARRRSALISPRERAHAGARKNRVRAKIGKINARRYSKVVSLHLLT